MKTPAVFYLCVFTLANALGDAQVNFAQHSTPALEDSKFEIFHQYNTLKWESFDLRLQIYSDKQQKFHEAIERKLKHLEESVQQIWEQFKIDVHNNSDEQQEKTADFENSPVEEQKQNQNELKKLIETVVTQSRQERSELLREFQKISVLQEVMLKKLETRQKDDAENAKSCSESVDDLNYNLTLFYGNITGQLKKVSDEYKNSEEKNHSILQNLDKRETNMICVGSSGGQKLSCYIPDHPYPNSCASNNSTQCSQGKCRIGNVLLGSKPFQVTCDHITDGGGWLVIQRRINGSVDFYRSWTDYKDGFGDLDGEIWLGLDKINAMTTTLAPVELLIQLKDHDDVMRYAKYDEFGIGNEAESYELQKVGQYEGNAGDPLSPQKGYKFSTMDKDNDVHRENCAVDYKGAWWYFGCGKSNLNGFYYKSGIVPASDRYQGIHWSDFHGFGYSLKFVQMLIRPRKRSSY